MPVTTYPEIEGAPKAVGPYSVCAEASGLLFLSGQVGIDPATQAMKDDSVSGQAGQIMRNIEAVLIARGRTLQDVVKTTIFLTDTNDFPTVNAIYAEAMGSHRPARSTITVAALPMKAKVEIEVVVSLS